MKDVKNICVVGAGNMGHQIAIQFARHGYKVACTDISGEMLHKAKTFAGNWIDKQVGKNRMTHEEGAAMRDRLSFTDDLKAAASDADLAIEAIVESVVLKRQLFGKLDTICQPHTILATNSSYIVSSLISSVTRRPGKVLNMHFFNPALIMKLVEVVKGEHVADETIDTVMEVVRSIDRAPILVRREIYGFVANRIFSSIMREACFLLEQGVASIEDIDNAVRNGLGHPLGPFQLLDLTGIDLEYRVLMDRFTETGDHRDKPGPAIVERYARGEYGRKSKRGFYQYES